MADYPGTIPAKPSIVTADMSAATTHATDRGKLWDELRAALIELGTTPSGSFSTVKLRLEDIEADVLARLPLAGGTLSGHVLGITPTLAAHLTRKDYVDAGLAGKVNDTGDTVTGQILINTAAGEVDIVLRRSTHDPMIDFQSTVGARYGYIQGTSGGMVVQSEADLAFFTNNSQRARMVGTVFLLGKTASDLDVSGVEIFMIGSSVKGSVRSTTDAASIQNLYCRHMSSADAGGEDFVQFARTSAGTIIGSISQVSTTGVAYNTTSDERLKTVLRDLGDDEIATILRLIAPVVFEFNDDPGNEHVGFIAQQLAATWPTFVDVGIVTPGRGDPDDVVEFDDEGNQVSAGFVPWMVDLSKLTPLLVAGWQQLDRRIAALEAA